MIQDIAPHIFNNEFTVKEPADGDCVLVYRDDDIFLREGERLSIPRYRELKEWTAAAPGELIYLFSIDDTSYFLFLTDEATLPAGFAAKHNSFFRKFQPSWKAFAGVTGHQLYRWYREHRFCGKCGGHTKRDGKERALVCPDCATIVYPKLSPAVIVGITDGDRLLMTKYSGRAYRNYALVAGFVEIGETLEETVHREVMEEVGLKVKNIRYFSNQPWSFTDSLLIGFFADLDGSPEVVLDTDELSEAVWVSREEIPPPDTSISLTANIIEAFRTGRHLQA